MIDTNKVVISTINGNTLEYLGSTPYGGTLFFRDNTSGHCFATYPSGYSVEPGHELLVKNPYPVITYVFHILGNDGHMQVCGFFLSEKSARDWVALQTRKYTHMLRSKYVDGVFEGYSLIQI